MKNKNKKEVLVSFNTDVVFSEEIIEAMNLLDLKVQTHGYDKQNKKNQHIFFSKLK